MHIGVAVLVTSFLLLGWWQVSRAADGNAVSFGYAIEWPAFAVFVIWVWIKEMRKAVRPREDGDAAVPVRPPPAAPAARTSRQPPGSGPAYDDTDDEQLAAYNHYLAWLNANPTASPAAYPGPARSEENR